MTYHYVWLLWSTAFLVPWLSTYAVAAGFRREMLRPVVHLGVVLLRGGAQPRHPLCTSRQTTALQSAGRFATTRHMGRRKQYRPSRMGVS